MISPPILSHPSPVHPMLRRLTYIDCIQLNMANKMEGQRQEVGRRIKSINSSGSLCWVTSCWQFPSTTPLGSVSPTAIVIPSSSQEPFSSLTSSTSLQVYILELTPKNFWFFSRGKWQIILYLRRSYIHAEVLVCS